MIVNPNAPRQSLPANRVYPPPSSMPHANGKRKRVGIRIDDFADPVTGLPEHVIVGRSDEGTALNAVARTTQDRGNSGPARVVADVAGVHMSQRRNNPV
jgi:hypothetical protein